jgi:hypothetical protein
LLHYNVPNALEKPSLTEDEQLELFENNIKIVPKLYIDHSIRSYIVISFDNFVPNETNPEFRDNLIIFDIVCHHEQWKMKGFQLRPYKIAAEIDTMFNEARLTGIGKLKFVGSGSFSLGDDYSSISLMYAAIHGEEDKVGMLDPRQEA